MSGGRSAAGAVASLAPLLLALAGCQGSDPQPLDLVSIDRFGGPDSLVDGGGGASTFGYTTQGGSFLPTLRLVRHDAASPGLVEPIGDVSFTGGASITRLHVDDGVAAVVVGGAVRVVDLTIPTLPTEPIPVTGAVDVAVSGRWVAAAVDHGLVLVNRDDLQTTYPLAASTTPTGLLAAGSGFLAFTTTGYLAVDVAGAVPTLQAVSDPVLRDLRSGAVAGGAALVAGPGASSDRARVLRLDLTEPAAPTVVRSLELPGAYVGLAWDGGTTSVLAVHGAGDDVRPESFHQGFLLRETAGGFQAAGVPLPFWSLSGQPLAAHADHLLAVQPGGVALLRIR